MKAVSPHQLGRIGEGLAAEHMEHRGYRIVARNYRTRYGEIDLIVSNRDWLVFCEVKSRRPGPIGRWESFTYSKRAQVRKIARIWLSENESRCYRQLRFDAIAVLLDDSGHLIQIDHLEGAF